MKRKIFALALAGLVAFSFTSCGDDDDDNNTPAPVNPNNNQDSNNNNNNNNNNQGNGNENQGNGNENQGSGKNHYIVVDVPAMEANPWDSQFWIYLGDETVAEGDDIAIKMKVKADVETPQTGDNPVFMLQWHAKPSDYAGNMACGMNFTTEWKELELTDVVGAVPEKGYLSITWNLNNFADANKYYFDDISVKVNGVEKVVNGNMEGTDFKSFYKKELNTDTDPVVVTEANVKEE